MKLNRNKTILIITFSIALFFLFRYIISLIDVWVLLAYVFVFGLLASKLLQIFGKSKSLNILWDRIKELLRRSLSR